MDSTVHQTNPISLVKQSELTASLMMVSCYIAGVLKQVEQSMAVFTAQHRGVAKRLDRLEQSHESALRCVADCQQETAQLLNREFERYALHPAVKAVALLADQLTAIADQAKAIKKDSDDFNRINDFLQELDIAGVLAAEQMANLDIAILRPDPGQELDYKCHQACGSTATDDPSLHRRIAAVLNPGLSYCGDVLQPAQVNVYNANPTTERKEQ